MASDRVPWAVTQPRSIAFRPVTPGEVVLDALARLSAAFDEADARIARRPAARPPADEPEEAPLRTVVPVDGP